jgi:hypothetical protein
MDKKVSRRFYCQAASMGQPGNAFEPLLSENSQNFSNRITPLRKNRSIFGTLRF